MKRRCISLVCLVLLFAGSYACSSPERGSAVLPELLIGGTIYNPYFFRDVTGEYAGVDAELAREACRRLGYTPVFREVSVTGRFDALADGSVDCLWSCVTMNGHEDDYLWAGPYLYTQRVVAVRADSDILSLAGLAGRRVAVLAGSSSERIILRGMNPDLPALELVTSLTTLGEVFTALRKGYADAIVSYEYALQVYTGEYEQQFRYLEESVSQDTIGVAFLPSADADLAARLGQVLSEMAQDGTTAEILTSYGLDAETNLYDGGTADATA